MLLLANINGEYRYPGQAMVPVNDLGLLRGYGVFEYLRTYSKSPFRMDDHLERLRNSAAEFHLPLPSNDNIKSVVKELIRRADPQGDVGVRLLLTGGTSSDGMSVNKPNFIITVERLSLPSEQWYSTGVKLLTFQYKRELPHIKTTNYQNSIRFAKLKQDNEAFDLLYHDHGYLLETSRNNFFIFTGDKLITPKEDILHGITRKTILELAEGNFEVEERKIVIEELAQATEMFVTGTTKKILPVRAVNDQMIGSGTPGVNTKKLMDMFEKYILDSK
jgi:branched-chain amino acid aminotransferase